MTTNGSAKNANARALPAKKDPNRAKIYRSASTGRIFSASTRIAAAQARVTADKKRNVQTEQWIIDLAQQG